jgi:phosphohistidine swiveling domain-containing protein
VAASGSTYESLRRIEILARDWITEGQYQQATLVALELIQGSPKLTHSLEADIEAAAAGSPTTKDIACRWGYSYLNMNDMLDLSCWRSWREDDAPLQTAIALVQQGTASPGVAERFRLSLEGSEGALRLALRSLKRSDAQKGQHRARVFRACVDASRQCFTLKDDRDLVLSHAQSALRWVLLAAGRRFRREGALEGEESVFLLRPQEIVDALSRSRADAAVLRALVRRRIEEQRRLARYTLPDTTGVAEPPDSDAEVLRGVPASPGVAEGSARIVTDLADIEDLAPGEILCLRGEKRVGWTIFFPTIAGLIYEKGNWLCHESNLCRELGIPAVVSLGERMAGLRQGERLRINGGEGTVARLER